MDRKGKPSKGKGKPSKPSKPSKPTIPESCCCEAGEGSGENPGSGEKPGPGGEMPEPRGFCIDEEKMGAICMAGSSIMEKALASWDVCADQCEGYMRSSGLLDMRAKKPKGKGKGKPSKGKPSKCATVSKIMDKTAEEYACEYGVINILTLSMLIIEQVKFVILLPWDGLTLTWLPMIT
jgi:hypothetical protein